jgi:hypothetical protein
MKVLINNTNYTETINMAINLKGEYNKQVIFHCYWYGTLNEKHLYSILSCYYFNVYNNKHKIILWLDNNTPNEYNDQIEKYAEIRYFSENDEKINTNFLEKNYECKNKILSFYSDFVRYLLLYNYGGVWFDLDCFILRSFDPLFNNYGNEICVYQWANLNYPNGAIYMSLEPKSEKMKNNIEYIIKRDRGFGFQEANLTYDLPLDMLVLPCSWFDACWIQNNENMDPNMFFKNVNKQFNFDNFFNGSFCYHWHNRWNEEIHDNCIPKQLVKIIMNNIENNKDSL